MENDIDPYEDYFTGLTVGSYQKLEKEFPEHLGKAVIEWGRDNKPSLYEELLFHTSQSNQFWETAGDFEAFKKHSQEMFKLIHMIYVAYAKT